MERLDHAVVVVGVLQIGFGQDAIARGCRLTGQRLVFVEDLVGIAADPDVGAAAESKIWFRLGGRLELWLLGLVMVIVATSRRRHHCDRRATADDCLVSLT